MHMLYFKPAKVLTAAVASYLQDKLLLPSGSVGAMEEFLTAHPMISVQGSILSRVGHRFCRLSASSGQLKEF